MPLHRKNGSMCVCVNTIVYRPLREYASSDFYSKRHSIPINGETEISFGKDIKRKV